METFWQYKISQHTTNINTCGYKKQEVLPTSTVNEVQVRWPDGGEKSSLLMPDLVAAKCITDIGSPAYWVVEEHQPLQMLKGVGRSKHLLI